MSRATLTQMPFGKYKGLPLDSEEIPTEYLEWAKNNLSIPWAAAACRREWEDRTGNDPVSREYRMMFR